jgi:D-sedoheptulose 7-phosphate isomerase
MIPLTVSEAVAMEAEDLRGRSELEWRLDGRALVAAEFAEHLAVLTAAENALAASVMQAIECLHQCLKSGGKILLFGNGGSAADAQHIAAEFLVRYRRNRGALAALALTTDSSTLTACGNDLGFESIFERQIEGLGRPADAAVGISTSGTSPNVVRGLKKAKEMGLRTLALTGGTGGHLRSMCDVSIVIPSAVTARIQEMHILIGHILCKALEDCLESVAP